MFVGRESVIRMQHCVTDMDAHFLKDSGSSFPRRLNNVLRCVAFKTVALP